MRSLVAIVAVLATAVLATSAHACSCVAPGDPRTDVSGARAAFYGEVISRDVRSAKTGAVDYHFRVLLDVKHNLGQQVKLSSTTQSTACGLDLQKGQKIGLLLSLFHGRYVSSSCAVRSKRELELGAAPRPKPDGKPPAGFLVGGAFGTAKVATLDATGHLLALAGNHGSTSAVSACPGSTFGVQGVTGLQKDRSGIIVRDIVTLKPVLRRVLPGAFVTAVHCLSEDGSRSYVATSDGNADIRLLYVDGGKVHRVYRGGETSFTFSGSRVWLSGAGGVRTIDIGADDDHRLAGLPDDSYVLSANPSGTAIAVQAGQRLLVANALDGTITAKRTPAPFEAAWITDDRLAISRDPGILILNSELKRVKNLNVGYATPVPTFNGQVGLLGKGKLNIVDSEGAPVAKTFLFTSSISVAAGLAPPVATATSMRATRCWQRANRRVARRI